MVKGRWGKLFSFLLSVVLVAGCSAPGASTNKSTNQDTKQSNSNTPPASGETVTLKLTGIEYPYTKNVIEDFEKRNPNIKVEWSAGGINFEDGSVQALLRSGTGPDALIVNSGPGRVGLLSNGGLIASLDDVYKKNNIEDRYQKWVIDQIRSQGKGKIYEIVEGVDVFQVYYNKELFEKNGIKVPTNWDEFFQASDKFKKANILPLAAGIRKGIGGGWLLGNIVEATAGKDRMTDVIYGNGNFDQKEIIDAGVILKKMVDNGYINSKEASAIDQDQASAEFLNGKAAMNISSQGFLVKAKKDGMDISKYGAFLLPTTDPSRPSRPSAGLAHSWVVNATTKKMPAVEKWLEWVSSPDYLRIAVANGAVLVPVIKVPSDIKLDDAIQDANKKLENGAGYNPSVYLPPKAKDAWYSAVEGIVTGTASPESAMKSIQSELEKDRQKK